MSLSKVCSLMYWVKPWEDHLFLFFVFFFFSFFFISKNACLGHKKILSSSSFTHSYTHLSLSFTQCLTSFSFTFSLKWTSHIFLHGYTLIIVIYSGFFHILFVVSFMPSSFPKLSKISSVLHHLFLVHLFVHIYTPCTQ